MEEYVKLRAFYDPLLASFLFFCFLVPLVLLCVCVCVRVCVCVCVCTSIHREGFISLDQGGYHGTDQRCYVKDVDFLCQVPSALLQSAVPNLSN